MSKRWPENGVGQEMCWADVLGSGGVKAVFLPKSLLPIVYLHFNRALGKSMQKNGWILNCCIEKWLQQKHWVKGAVGDEGAGVQKVQIP